jgi:two-component system cell cycle sensor histidine kinase/response regulator CckA
VNAPRRILIVDDSPDDAELAAQALRRGGFSMTYQRVDTPEAMHAALGEGIWDVVIADYAMPRFNGLAALKILRDTGLDLPFILVSGTVGEELAVEAMRRGADDYVLKSNLARLPLAVERELRDCEVRVERNRLQARYRSLADRVPVGLFRVSPERQFLEANPALIEMLGFRDAESLKQTDGAGFWLRPDELARFQAVIASEGIVKNFEMEIRRPDDSVIWCEQSARAIYDAAGNVEHYEGVLVDINSRKLAEAEINRARDRVRDIALEAARLRS